MARFKLENTMPRLISQADVDALLDERITHVNKMLDSGYARAIEKQLLASTLSVLMNIKAQIRCLPETVA